MVIPLAQESGIAWSVDDQLYGNVTARNFQPEGTIGGGSIGRELSENGTVRLREGETALNDDEHFMVWMRVDARPTIRKLYA